MTEDHGKLAGVRMRGSVMANAQPPSIQCVDITISAGTEVGGRGIDDACWRTPKGWRKAERSSRSLAHDGACGWGILPTIDNNAGILAFRAGRF